MAQSRFCELHSQRKYNIGQFNFSHVPFQRNRSEVKGALTYFLGCVAKEYVCGITWKFFATHRSFYNTALVINIEIEQ